MVTSMVKRPAPMVLVVEQRADRALLRAGGSARPGDVARLCDYVMALADWSSVGGGWVIAESDLPDVRAAAELGHWVVRDTKAIR